MVVDVDVVLETSHGQLELEQIRWSVVLSARWRAWRWLRISLWHHSDSRYPAGQLYHQTRSSDWPTMLSTAVHATLRIQYVTQWSSPAGVVSLMDALHLNSRRLSQAHHYSVQCLIQYLRQLSAHAKDSSFPWTLKSRSATDAWKKVKFNWQRVATVC